MKGVGADHKAEGRLILVLAGVFAACAKSPSQGSVGVTALSDGGKDQLDTTGDPIATFDAGGDAVMPIDPSVFDFDEVVCAEPTAIGWACPDIPTLCGNGVIDSCAVANPFGQGAISDVPEACDGAVSAATTCVSLGYQSGQLACGPWCGFDVTGCTTCTSDPQISACQDHALNHLEQTLIDMSADATRATLLLWNGNSTQFRLSMVGADLSLVAPERCFSTSILPHALAHTKNGWLLLSEHESYETGKPSALAITPLDDGGHKRGSARIVLGHKWATLVESSSGGPLLVAARDGSYDMGTSNWALDAILLDDDGNTLRQTHILDDDTLSISAVSTGTGFLVAGSRGGIVVKVGLTGAVESTHVHPLGPSQPPRLAWSGSEARLSWVDSEGQVHLARLDANGAAIGAPAVVLQGYLGPRADLVSGTFGTMLVLPTGLSAMVVDDSLNIKVAPFPFARSPGSMTMLFRTMGNDVIAGWTAQSLFSGVYSSSTTSLTIARLSP